MPYMWTEQEESLKQARARYAYLPSDELMTSLGYEHQHLGRYHKRRANIQLVISVFSQSGSFVLQRNKEVQAVAVITTDEELTAFLKENRFT
jgi:hypothetical protein